MAFLIRVADNCIRVEPESKQRDLRTVQTSSLPTNKIDGPMIPDGIPEQTTGRPNSKRM